MTWATTLLAALLMLLLSQTGLQIVTAIINQSQSQWAIDQPSGSIWKKNITIKHIKYQNENYTLNAKNINIQPLSIFSFSIKSLELEQVTIDVLKFPKPQINSSFGYSLHKGLLHSLIIKYNNKELINLTDLKFNKDKLEQHLSYNSENGPLNIVIQGPNSPNPTTKTNHHTIKIGPKNIMIWQQGSSNPFVNYSTLNRSWSADLKINNLQLPGLKNTTLHSLTLKAQGDMNEGDILLDLKAIHFNSPVQLTTRANIINNTVTIETTGKMNPFIMKAEGQILPNISINTAIVNPDLNSGASFQIKGTWHELTLHGSLNKINISDNAFHINKLTVDAFIEPFKAKLQLSSSGEATLTTTQSTIIINKLDITSSPNKHIITTQLNINNHTINMGTTLVKSGENWLGTINNLSILQQNQETPWLLLHRSNYTIANNSSPIFKDICLKQNNFNHFCVKGGITQQHPWHLSASLQQTLKDIHIPLPKASSTYISPVTTQIKGSFNLSGDINGINKFKGDILAKDIKANLYNLVPNLFIPLNLHLKSGHFKVESNQNLINLSGTFNATEGEIVLEGSKNTSNNQLNINIKSKKIALISKDKSSLTINPDIFITLNNNAITDIKGKINVVNGVIHLQKLNQVVEMPSDVTIMGDKEHEKTAQINLALQFSPLVKIHHLGFDGNISGHINIQNKNGTSITGSLVSTNATFKAFQRQTKINQATISFYNEPWLQGHVLLRVEKTAPHSQNPNSKHQLVKSSLQLYGPLNNLNFQLNSTPAHLADYEIVSLLLSTPAEKTPLTDAQIINIISGASRKNLKALMALVEALHSLESKLFIDQVFISNPSLTQGDVTDLSTYITLSKQIGKVTVQYQFNLIDETQKRMNFSFQLSPKTYLQTYIDQDKSGIDLFYKFSAN